MTRNFFVTSSIIICYYYTCYYYICKINENNKIQITKNKDSKKQATKLYSSE